MTEIPPPSLSDDLLVELGCEELPPKALDVLREAFFSAIATGLQKNHIEFDTDNSQSFSSPRRLAVLFSKVAAAQPDQDQERRGPSVAAAFDDNGNPTGAATGFARSAGVDVVDLETVKTEKGEWLYAQVHIPGKPLDDLIFPILDQAVKQLPVPKPMRWSSHDFSFVRPVHWLVILHGSRVINGRFLGLEASNHTRGHRFHSPGPHKIDSVRSYVETLESAHVIVDQVQRKARISELLREADQNVSIDDSLLAEVNNLVEWPAAVACEFDPEFLEVPHPALVASMQDHQKFFPVADMERPGSVTNRFVAIANIDSAQVALVRAGFERVIRPRLADARFFLEQDQKQALHTYLTRLDHVVFQQKIGTIGDKSRRISKLSKNIAELVSGNPECASRAAMLSKCDLMTQMVGEFPELQGVMGRYYALSSGEPEEVAEAIGEHYAPSFSGDIIPSTRSGQIVSIADRVDTLVGVFTTGPRPSGNKDPFALRRSALGLVRILLEAELELPLRRLLALASNELSEHLAIEPGVLLEVREFIVERTRNHYRERGYTSEIISAGLASGWDSLPDLDKRLRALSGFMGLDEAASLATANKRIGNILRKSGETISEEINTKLLYLDDERTLFDAITHLEVALEPILHQGDFEQGMQLLAGLREPVDRFFDTVMVMDEDPELRNNRLALLARMKSLFDRIGDLSVLG